MKTKYLKFYISKCKQNHSSQCIIRKNSINKWLNYTIIIDSILSIEISITRSIILNFIEIILLKSIIVFSILKLEILLQFYHKKSLEKL